MNTLRRLLAIALPSVGPLSSPRINLDSSCLKWARYDRSRHSLIVCFQNSGTIGEYGTVSPSEWRAMLRADSIGGFFVRNIRNTHPYRRVA